MGLRLDGIRLGYSGRALCRVYCKCHGSTVDARLGSRTVVFAVIRVDLITVVALLEDAVPVPVATFWLRAVRITRCRLTPDVARFTCSDVRVNVAALGNGTVFVAFYCVTDGLSVVQAVTLLAKGLIPFAVATDGYGTVRVAAVGLVPVVAFFT